MSCAIRFKRHNLVARSKQVESAPVDADKGGCVTHKVARYHSNRRVGRVVYSAIIVVATSGCYGRVGLEEPRHAQRNEAQHEERHEERANEHREEHHDKEHDDEEHRD